MLNSINFLTIVFTAFNLDCLYLILKFVILIVDIIAMFYSMNFILLTFNFKKIFVMFIIRNFTLSIHHFLKLSFIIFL